MLKYLVYTQYSVIVLGDENYQKWNYEERLKKTMKKDKKGKNS